MEYSMLVWHVAKGLNLKGAASTDKTHLVTLKYLGIQGIDNLCYRTLECIELACSCTLSMATRSWKLYSVEARA